MPFYCRPHSLLRLLNSLENSEYNFVEKNPNWQLLLEIRVDGGGWIATIFPLKMQTIVAYVASLDLHKHHRIEGGGEEGASVEHLANTFNFSHGQKVLT